MTSQRLHNVNVCCEFPRRSMEYFPNLFDHGMRFSNISLEYCSKEAALGNAAGMGFKVLLSLYEFYLFFIRNIELLLYLASLFLV